MAIELECPKDSLVEDKLLKFSDQAKTCELPSITLAEREKGEKKETKKRPRRMSKLRQDALRWQQEAALYNGQNPKVIPLENRWTLWYDERPPKGLKEVDYNSLIKKIGSFDTVQDFWRYWNNIVDPSKFPEGSNLRIFKHGIKPMWEDPANVGGGKWVVHTEKEFTSKRSIHAVLLLIGEQLEYNDDVCGVVISVRAKSDTISIWNRTSKDPVVVETTGDHIRRVLKLNTERGIPYKSHMGAMEYNKQFTHERYTARGKLRKSSMPIMNGSRGSSSGANKQGRHRRQKSYSGSGRTLKSTSSLRSPTRAAKSQSQGNYDGHLSASAPTSRSTSPDNTEERRHVNFDNHEAEHDAGSSPSKHRRGSSFSISPFDSSPTWRQHRKSHSDSNNKSKIPHLPQRIKNNSSPPPSTSDRESSGDGRGHKRWPSLDNRAPYSFKAPPSPRLSSARRHSPTGREVLMDRFSVVSSGTGKESWLNLRMVLFFSFLSFFAALFYMHLFSESS